MPVASTGLSYPGQELDRGQPLLICALDFADEGVQVAHQAVYDFFQPGMAVFA